MSLGTVRGGAWLVAIALLGLASTPVQASDETNRELVRFAVSIHLERGDLAAAAQALREHLKGDLEDPQAWRLYALVLSRQGKLPESKAALARALALAPEQEKASVASLLAPAAPGSGSKEQRAVSWFSMGLSGGYDTNVLLLTDATQAGATDAGQASPALAPSIRAGKTWKAGEDTWKLEGSSTFTWYSSAAAQTFDSLYSAASIGAEGPVHGRWKSAWSVDADLSFLNSNGFQFFNWGVLAYLRPVWVHDSVSETRLKAGAGYRKFLFEAGDDPDNDRSGPSASVGVQYRRKLGAWVLGAGLGWDKQFTRGDNYKSDALGAPVSLDWAFSRSWSLQLRGEPSATFYPKSKLGRSDRALDVGLDLGWKSGPHWSYSLAYSGHRNTSTYEDARYTKFQGMLGVTHAF